ncbi:hypothetical protein GCM10011309_16650 [Litorimonas cladophorae]|uniref:Uncharacterized protein n=1 Tax=Litorimonas cladophorae TaxID=1220491 RepID=A0A918KN89_9PROT|nr:hypothetical protein GCM10011309_16650 [Litorimonas cladophorae]
MRRLNPLYPRQRPHKNSQRNSRCIHALKLKLKLSRIIRPRLTGRSIRTLCRKWLRRL